VFFYPHIDIQTLDTRVPGLLHIGVGTLVVNKYAIGNRTPLVDFIVAGEGGF
jgi:hypothetical protein